MKICPKCKQEKSLTAFNKNRTTRDGLCVYCRSCISEINKQFNALRNLSKTFKYPFKRDQKKRATVRFEARYDPIPIAGCWIWLGATNPAGYGVFTWNGIHSSAHRFAYEQKHGPIPKGMFVCHRCDVKECVNPAHLFLGTAKDNSEDMVAKGRSCGPLRSKCAKLGLNYDTIWSRINKLGWSEARAFSEPIKHNKVREHHA